MTEQTSVSKDDDPASRRDEKPRTTEHAEEAGGKFLGQVVMMARAFMASPHRNRLLLLLFLVSSIISINAYFQILLNAWNEPFYDSLARKDLTEFLRQLGVFVLLAGALLSLDVSLTWLRLMVELKLRQGLVEDLIKEWMTPRRAFRLASSSHIGVNPDQRVHEDARHLIELATDLGIGLLRSSILLISFITVLWKISDGFAFAFGGYSITIPGYMVWAALSYAIVASIFSWYVGGPLIGLNANRYAREAEFRFSLVRVSEHIDAIALNGGEKDEERQLNLDLASVLTAMRRLVTATTKLTWVTSGYGWFTLIAPILVAAPIYFAGGLTFGGLMLAVGAFNQVQQALRWFVDNVGRIADWRATLLRVANFRRAVAAADHIEETANRIKLAATQPGRMSFDSVAIAASSGRVRLQENQVNITAGERVVIKGDRGASKTLLFRAIAGLWPFGAGTISLPEGESITFLPRRPYLSQGTLRQILAYPKPPAGFATPDFHHALASMGLGGLSADLDKNLRWDKELDDELQQSVAFARLVLQKPAWVVIDEALDGLDDEGRQKAMAIFTNELAGSTIIYIGRDNGQEHVFSRSLHLVSENQEEQGASDNALELWSSG